MVGLLVSLVVLSMIFLGILPVLDLAVTSDRSAENTSSASSVGTQVLETLKLYRAIQVAGGTVPSEFGGFAPTGEEDDPYEVAEVGVWQSLGVDPDRFDITYTLVNDAVSGRLQARVSVTTTDTLAGNRGGGDKWVEFTSLID